MSAAALDPERRARSLLAAHPQGRAIAALPFRPIVGGALNRSWRVDAVERMYYVRLADVDAKRLGADWDSEAVLLEVASAAGLAPQFLYALPAAGLLVCEFLAWPALSAADARTPAQIEAIGRLLRAVHELPPSPAIRRLDFAVQARTLEAQLDTPHASRFHSRSAVVFERLAASRRGPEVPCHNDVHAANLLSAGSRLVLIDWEYGGIGDPVFDLAGLTSHLSLDAERTAQLLDAYGSRDAAMRLADSCWAYDYVQWLWYRAAARRAHGGEAPQLIEVARRFERRLG